MKLNYYARLKEDNVCIEIVSTPKNLKGVKGHVSIPDYNETLMYRKYDESTGWSEERYEPEVDAVLQEKLNQLEEENQQLSTQVNSLESTLQNVNATNETLVQSIAELTAMIAMLQTP